MVQKVLILKGIHGGRLVLGDGSSWGTALPPWINNKVINLLEPKNNNKIARMRNSKHVRNMVISAVKPILENWSKIKLIDNVGVYGFRRYLRGSVLRMHVDRLPTHILSAILQVRPGMRPWETLGGS